MPLDLLEKMRAKRAALGETLTAPAGTAVLAPEDAAAPCPTCGAFEFWQDAYRHVACLACQPPKSQAMVRRLLIATPDGWQQPIPRVDDLNEWFESLPVPPDPSAKRAPVGTVPCYWCGGRRFYRSRQPTKFAPVVTCLTYYPIPAPPAAECFELPGAGPPAEPDALARWVRALRPSVIPAGLRLWRWATISDPARLVHWLQASIHGGASSAEARRVAERLKGLISGQANQKR
jgi:hypothetical protein